MRLNISLKAALLTAFALLALICAGQGAVSIFKFGTIRQSVNEVATNWLPSVVAINTLREEVGEVRIYQLRLVALSDTPAKRAANEAAYAAAVTKVGGDRKAYEPLISSVEERAPYDEFAARWTRYEAMGREVARLAEEGRHDEALALISQPENIKIYNEASEALSRGVAFNERSAQQDAARSLSEADAGTRAAYVAVGIALAFSLAAGVFGLLRVSRPIEVITGAMKVLAGGDAAAEVPFRQRRDEIGAMATAVQVFKDNLIRSRKLEEETVLARAGAEAQRKAGMIELADGFERAVGSVIGMVSSAATELQGTAQAMSATAGQTASQSTTVAAAAEEAASNVNTVAAAAEELGSSVQEIGRQVGGSAELARMAVSEAEQTAGLVQTLSAAAAEIGNVVALISSIAGQTNLLALNATIEAARAGEAGRGFAVVASEVKELASQTAKATDEISTQIARIQGSTGQAVTAIGAITSRIREISGVATSLSAAVEEQGAATQEIVRNVSQAAMGTGEVTANIASVASAADETGAAAAQVLASASELSRQSEHLRSEVARFLGTVRAA